MANVIKDLAIRVSFELSPGDQVRADGPSEEPVMEIVRGVLDARDKTDMVEAIRRRGTLVR